jgi:hypothetical protein
MPFKSRDQAKFMFRNMPKMAKRWAKHTKSISALPKKVECGEFDLDPQREDELRDRTEDEEWPAVNVPRMREVFRRC